MIIILKDINLWQFYDLKLHRQSDWAVVVYSVDVFCDALFDNDILLTSPSPSVLSYEYLVSRYIGQ